MKIITTTFVVNFSGTTGLSRPLSGKTLLGRSSLSKASGAKSASKMTGEEESLERCVQSIVENCVRGIYGCALHVQCSNERNLDDDDFFFRVGGGKGNKSLEPYCPAESCLVGVGTRDVLGLLLLAQPAPAQSYAFLACKSTPLIHKPLCLQCQATITVTNQWKSNRGWLGLV